MKKLVVFFGLVVAGCGSGHEGAAPAVGRWLGAQRIDGAPAPSSRASSPSLAIDGSGRAVVAWARDQTILANRFVPGRGWGDPEAVTPGAEGVASGPIVAMNASGAMVVVWFGSGTPYSWPPARVWASRSGPAGGWSEPVVIDGGATLDPWQLAASVDAAGNAVVLWTSDGIVAARHAIDRGWSPPERLSAVGGAPVVASGPAGRAVAAWGELGTTVAASYDASRGWFGLTRFEPAPGWSAFGPVIAVDAVGRALLAWESRNRDRFGPAIVWAASFDGSAWSPPSVVSDPRVKSYAPAVALRERRGLVAWTLLGADAGVPDGVAFSHFAFGSGYEGPGRVADGANSVTAGAALSLGGGGFVAWAQTEARPGSEELWYRLWASRYAGGVWGPAQPLQAGPGPAQYPQVAADDGGSALVVWAEDEGDSTRIWSNRFEIAGR